MGQRYRIDPRTGLTNVLEPSPAQLRWLNSAGAAGGLEPAKNYRVMRACRDNGWVRSEPVKLVSMLEYYAACWSLTEEGRSELAHQRERVAFAQDAGVENRPAIAKLML